MNRLKRSFALPGFRSISAAYSVNELGNWFGEVALAILVFDQTGSALASAGLFLSMQFVPALLSQAVVARGELAGIRKALALFYASEGVVFIALALAAGHFSLAVIIALAAIDGTLATANRALVRAAAGSILRPAGLLRDGNSIINISFTAASVVGPLLAGLAVAGLGIQTTLLLDAVSFLVVAVILLRVRQIAVAETNSVSWAAHLRQGIRYVSGRLTLRRLLWANGALWLFISAAVPVEIIFVRESLGAGNSAYGLLLAAWGGGMFLGSLAFAAARQTQLKVLVLIGGIAVGLSYVALGAAPTMALACVAAIVGGVGNGVLWVATVSAVQSLTSDTYQARVLALLESTSSAVPGAGFALGGVLTVVWSPRVALAAAGFGVLGVMTIATIVLRSARWGRDDIEVSTTDPVPDATPSSPSLVP